MKDSDSIRILRLIFMCNVADEKDSISRFYRYCVASGDGGGGDGGGVSIIVGCISG